VSQAQHQRRLKSSVGDVVGHQPTALLSGAACCSSMLASAPSSRVGFATTLFKMNICLLLSVSQILFFMLFAFMLFAFLYVVCNNKL